MSPPNRTAKNAGMPEFMMPVGADAASMQFLTEALRANTSTIEGFREDAREDRKLLNDIHLRVVRMETQNVAGLVVLLTNRVDALETEMKERVGAHKLRDWTIKHVPNIATVLVVIFGLVVVVLKSRGLL